MEENTRVIEYKCPCCNAGLLFSGSAQKLTCEYCENTFDIETVRAFNEDEAKQTEETIKWEDASKQEWNQEEENTLQGFACPSCGGEILTDITTAATFCPFCDNPTIMPSRVSGTLRPDAMIPFQKTKEDAQRAFQELCKGKPLLPKEFTTQQRLEKITGVYVPFWLYDCSADFSGSYKATRIHMWSDRDYHYTKTDHYLVQREAEAEFTGIPLDGSAKMDDTFMESIEPYDYSQLTDFDMAYLTGFLADKYDVESSTGEDRIRQRVDAAINDNIQNSLIGYHSLIPSSRQLHVDHGKARYVLFPVWMLNTRYQDKIYTFAMNGQTGKMTGEFPVCPKRTAAWFSGICAGVTALAMLVQWMLL